MKRKGDFIFVEHKECGRVFRVTRNCLPMLYCPVCETDKGFEELKNESMDG